MPLLLDDLAQDARRAAADRDALGRAVGESARRAVDYALSRLGHAEVAWQSALASLRGGMTGDDAIQLLRALLSLFDDGRRSCEAATTLRDVAEGFGASGGAADDLARARDRFDGMAADARKAIDHRERGWQPTDPDRLAAALRLAREGKTVTADEARSWFHRSRTVETIV